MAVAKCTVCKIVQKVNGYVGPTLSIENFDGTCKVSTYDKKASGFKEFERSGEVNAGRIPG